LFTRGVWIMTNDVSQGGYRRPELKVYGEMKVLTQSNISMNMNDKGNGSQTMT
jgi:hypothetical protein